MSVSSIVEAYKPGNDKPESFIFFNTSFESLLNIPLGLNQAHVNSLMSKGIKGIIFPIWRVSDENQKQITQRFYIETIENKCSVGEALFKVRKLKEDNVNSLGYIYYGHPALILNYTKRYAESTSRVLFK